MYTNAYIYLMTELGIVCRALRWGMNPFYHGQPERGS